MSKFKTAVVSSLYILGLAFVVAFGLSSSNSGLLGSHPAFAEGSSPTTSPGIPQWGPGWGGPPPESDDRLNKRVCNEANTKWHQAVSKFGEACTKANMTNRPRDKHINCSLEAQRCRFCGSEDESDPMFDHFDCSELHSAEQDESSLAGDMLRGVMDQMTGSAPRSSQQTAKFQARKRAFQACPASAGEGLEEQQKRTDEIRKDLQKDEDALLKLQEDMAKAKEEGEERLTKMVEDAEQLAQNYQDKTEELKQKIEDQDRKLGEQVMELEANLREAQQTVKSINLARQSANNEFMDKLAEQERRCHSQALAQVAKWNENRRQQMAQGNYGGNMAQMFQGANQGALKQAQDRAQRLYQACVRDRAFTSQKQSHERAREMSLRQLQQQEAAAIQTQNLIVEQIKRLQTEVRNQQMQRSLQQMERLTTQYQREHQRLERNYAQQSMRLQQQLFRMQQQIQVATTRLDAARNQFNEEESLLELQKRFASGGGSTKAQAVAAAQTELTNVQNAGLQLWSDCQCHQGRATSLSPQICESVAYFFKDAFNSPNMAAEWKRGTPSTESSGSGSPSGGRAIP